jgi:hypothetical protein
VAAKFIKNTLGKREEHGKGMVSSEDRHRIQVAKSGLERWEKLRRQASSKALRSGGARHQRGTGGWISQEIRDGRDQGIGRMKLDDSPRFAEFFHDISKILHVRTHNHRLIGQNRFNRVWAAYSKKAFADHGDGGGGIPIPQFSGRVDEQDGWLFPKIGIRAQGKLNISAPQELNDFRGSLHVLARPRSWQTKFIRSAESDLSRTVKEGSTPICIDMCNFWDAETVPGSTEIGCFTGVAVMISLDGFSEVDYQGNASGVPKLTRRS